MRAHWREDDEWVPAEAGWYRDPSGQLLVRWWDGARWTDHTRPMTGMNGRAVTAFVLAMVGFACWLTAPFGLYHGVKAWSDIDRYGGEGKGFAIAAVVVSALLVLAGGGAFLWVFFYGAA